MGTLNGDGFGVLEPQNLVIFNGAEWGGAVLFSLFFAAGVRKKRGPRYSTVPAILPPHYAPFLLIARSLVASCERNTPPPQKKQQ